MRFISLSLFIALTNSCSFNKNKSIPNKMPADFKIEYHYDGGMTNEHRNITLQMGECADEGRYNEDDFEYKFTITDTNELVDLYNNLKKLNAFNLKYKDRGHVDDRGGASIRYRINGKDYKVSDSQSNFIDKADADAFNKSIELIVWFAESHRKPKMAESSPTEEGSGIVIEKTDTTETVVVYKNDIPESKQDDNMSKTRALELDEYTGISAKMPNDFKIKYEMSGGIAGEYRTITIQFGSSTDEGKKSGESKYSKSWINKDLKEYEILYNALYKLNAFTLKYTTNDKVADRGGESIKFTISKKEYVVSDKDNNYLKPGDKPAFKKAVALILAYSDKND